MNPYQPEINPAGKSCLIQELTKDCTIQHSDTILGIQDDAAIIAKDEDCNTLVSTKMLIEHIDFDLTYFPLVHLGYKAVVSSIINIIAMFGVPKQILVSIGYSNRFSSENIQKLYEGIQKACKVYQLDLIGGDTRSSVKGLILNVTSIGTGIKGGSCKRSGAKLHDLLCVTGDLGASYLGLQILEREKQVFLNNPKMQPELEAYAYLVQRQLKPEVPINMIKELKKLPVTPTAMIDISASFVQDVYHLGKASGMGMQIYEDRLPIHALTRKTADQLQLDPITCALNGGEDYEILFTISPKAFEQIKDLPNVSCIGHCIAAEQGYVMVLHNGESIRLIR